MSSGFWSGLIALNMAFAQAASQPYTEQTQVTPQAKEGVACTVAFNHRVENDPTPVDIRFHKKHVREANPATSERAAALGSYSGITYTQYIPLESNDPYFRYVDKKATAEPIDVMFNGYEQFHGRYKPDGKGYYDLNNPKGYTLGYIADARFENWNYSFETDLKADKPDSAARCLTIRKALISWPPDYGKILGETSDSFARKVWSVTGKNNDEDALKKDPTVRFISREERLNAHRESGKIQPDYSDIPAPFLVPNR